MPVEAKPLSAKASRDKEKDAKTPDPEEDEAHKRRSYFLSSSIHSSVIGCPFLVDFWHL